MSKLERYRVINTNATTRIGRALENLRSYFDGPWSLKDRELSGHFLGGRSASSGVLVNERTALRYAPVSEAVSLISDDVSSLPLFLYKRLPNGGKDRFESHPLYDLLHDEPNPEMGSMVFRRTMQAHALLWRNAYAEIERDNANKPVALWPLVPERVTKERQRGQVVYRVSNPSGGEVFIPAANMLHLVGQSHDGSIGDSLVNEAREAFGLGLAAEKYGATFFGNGATVGGVISIKGPKPPEMSEKGYRESLEARHSGVDRAHKLMVLYNDATFTQNSVPPNDGQFNETRLFQVREVARFFKLPPHMLGDLADATYSNVEQMQTAYYTSCLRPWLVLWQQELGRKLIARAERRIQFIEHEAKGFLMADAAGRAQLHTAMFHIGAITPNEIRNIENMDPIDGGDRAFVQLAMTPLDRVDQVLDAELETKKAAKSLVAIPQPEPDPKQAKRIEELEQELALARRKSQEAEDAKDIANNSLTEVRADLLRERQAHLEAVQSSEAEIARLTAQATSLGTDLATATGDLATETERVDALQADCDEARATVASTMAAHVKAVTWGEGLEVERNSLKEQTEGLSFDIVAAQEETARANTRADAAEQRTQVSEAVVTELRTQVAALTIETEARHNDVVTVNATAAKAIAERDASMEEHAMAVEMRRQAETALQSTKDALRAALAYALSSVIRRESDRARKAQASPEKLLRHVENFYSTHAEFCRENLRPILRAVAALDGRDANTMLNQLVPVMVEESTIQLRLVAADADPETLAPALERVLRRWEAERGDALADRVMRQGDTDGR